jgi:hypothetical protein
MHTKTAIEPVPVRHDTVDTAPLSAIRGDRYLADAYQPARRSSPDERGGSPDPRRRRRRARSIRRRAAAIHHGRRLSDTKER